VSYPLPTSITSDYTAGSALTTLPTTTRAPQLVVSSAGFSTLIGFPPATYPSTQQTTLTTSVSATTPVVSDVINVLVSLDVVSNPFSNNSFVIHAISPAGVSFGHIITDAPNELSFMKCQPCSRDSITLTFTDQNRLPLLMTDYDVVVLLKLRKKTMV
jgi:hypothetical protein